MLAERRRLMLRGASLQSKIIAYIQEHIEQNHLKEGDKLPSQAELARQMGVSVISVREAVKTLEARDMLTVRNGIGVFVKDYFKHAFSAQIDIKAEKESLLELLHIRKILEKEVLSMFIKNASEEEMDTLGSITGELMDKYRAGLNQTMEDRMFHSFLYQNCHNKVITTLIMSIYDMLAKFQEFPLELRDPFTETIPLHEAMYQAIRERKIKKAQSINNEIFNIMVKDIQNA
jgi:DNA-binding FadR family transcriptional regulator